MISEHRFELCTSTIFSLFCHFILWCYWHQTKLIQTMCTIIEKITTFICHCKDDNSVLFHIICLIISFIPLNFSKFFKNDSCSQLKLAQKEKSQSTTTQSKANSQRNEYRKHNFIITTLILKSSSESLFFKIFQIHCSKTKINWKNSLLSFIFDCYHLNDCSLCKKIDQTQQKYRNK